ncbi:MAG TPA: hypothetical protein PKE45_17055, partial [Caldilineaceae bacterium]|nr:hypothetical protein [Caldilineaceae bacterium]
PISIRGPRSLSLKLRLPYNQHILPRNIFFTTKSADRKQSRVSGERFQPPIRIKRGRLYD